MVTIFKMRQQEEKKPETYTEVVELVQNIITNERLLSEDELIERQRLIQNAMAGLPAARVGLMEVIEEILQENQIDIDNLGVLAEKIYRQNWGLGALEDAYHDPTIDEIRVNGPGRDQVYLVREGKSELAGFFFEDEREIQTIVRRLLMHDTAVGLDQSQPQAESMRKDGTRITAACPPVNEYWTFVLRRHDTFEMTPENLVNHGTLDYQLWEMLVAFARYGANMLIVGGVNTGKTHLLRRLIAETLPSRRIICIETDRELNLQRHYPDRDIVEFEEHKNVGASMAKIFVHVLRYSADILVVGEFRGHGEAREAMNACTRGCQGFATAHFSSVSGAVEGTGKMMIQEGQNIPLDIAKSMVAEAFNLVVEMVASRDKGIKKIINVTELISEDGEVKYNPLVKWVPIGEDYFEGKWVFPNPPSENLVARMRQNGLTKSQAEKWGWPI